MNFENEFKVSHSEYPQYFKKLFLFQKTKEWILPQEAFKAPQFSLSETQNMKSKLNKVKGQLSEFDLAHWSKHTHDRDIAGYIMDHLRKKIKPELMTQAWCKFYEIINTLSVVSEIITDFEEFKSLHLCEAPGAFVCALNHYLTLEYPYLQWQWLANTLNPNYEGTPLSQMISDDRLIRHTLSHWVFGRDLTGDIQKFYNHEAIINEIGTDEKMTFVTADGSINCMSDPGEQERLVEFLHFSETLTALAVLKKGGSFILKIFTIFEDSTICLLYLLNCTFKQVSVFKPCTSKSGNSEVYVICKDYTGIDTIAHLWADLTQPYKSGAFNKKVSMFSKDDIPDSFYLQVLNCSEYFMERQISTIEDNIYYYLNPDKTESAVLHKLKLGIAKEYLRRFKLRHIPICKKIVPHRNIHVYKRKLEDVEGIILSRNSLSVSIDSISRFLEMKTGKRIDAVHNSKFILKSNLENLLQSCERRAESQKNLYNFVLNSLIQKNIVINISEFNLIPYYSFQKLLFFKLKDAIFSNRHLILINVPFHTHFLAGLFCLLAAGFEKVYFFSGLVIFYHSLKPRNILEQVIFQIERLYQNSNKDIFETDVLQILTPEAFDHELNAVTTVLNVCNTFYLCDNAIIK